MTTYGIARADGTQPHGLPKNIFKAENNLDVDIYIKEKWKKSVHKQQSASIQWNLLLWMPIGPHISSTVQPSQRQAGLQGQTKSRWSGFVG